MELFQNNAIAGVPKPGLTISIIIFRHTSNIL